MKRGYLKRVMMILSIIITVGASAQLREFEDNFESGDLAKWSQTAASPVQWSVGTGVWQVSASEGSMYAYLYAVARQAPVKLVTSSLNLTSLKEPVLTFMMAAPKFSNGDRDTLKLYYRRNVESAWTHIESFVATTQNWTEQHLNLTSYVYPTVEFAFEYNYGAGKGIAIDNVLIGSTALCTRPVDLRAQRVTHSSATLSWSANSYSTQFNIKVSTTPMTDFTQTADVFDGTSGFQTRLVTGLSASTTYYFYVQADCEDGDISTWSQAGTFTTGCAAYALPYKETFGAVGIGTGVLPSCWNTIVRAFGDWGTSVPAADYTPHCQRLGTDTMLSMFVYYNSSSYGAVPRRTESYTILPALGTGSLTGYQLSFDMSSVGRAKLHVGVMLDPKDESTFVEITSIVSTGGPEERYFVPLNTAPADYNYLAFRVDASDYNEIEKIYIDDLDVSPLPSCIKPSILQASALTDSSAILTWAGVSPSYLLRVSSTSIDPATALSADIFDGEVTAASQNIASLSSHTPYYFYVQAKCGEGDETSEWSSEATFTTEATIASIPYSCDFEDADQNRQWLLQNGTQTNKWVIGTAAAQSGSGLYISANGTTNAYTNTAESYVYAIRTLNLDAAGYYAFQYSWKSVGELRDVLRVFLVPASIELFAGNHYGVVSTFTSGMTPENWIDIGDGIHYGSSSWTTKKVEYSLATPGKYNLVFLWANDKSAGSTPPAAIDNISVVKLTCTGIEDVTATYVTNSSATISWFDKDLDASAWNVKVSTTALSNPSAETGNIFDGQITVRPHIVSGLLPARTYYAYVQSSCGEGSVSSWQSVSFTTLCGAEPVPYTENFGATSFPPMCWERYSGLATTVFINGILSPVETGWSTKSGSGITGSHAMLNIFGARAYWLVSPEIFLTKDTKLTFDLALTAANSGNPIASPNGQPDDKFMVVVSADAGQTWKAADATVWSNAGPKNYEFNRISNVAEKISILLNQYTGKTVRIAFYGESTEDNGDNDLHIGNIAIDEILPCEPPRLILDNVGKTSTQLSWKAGYIETAWELVYGAPGFNPADSTPVEVTVSPYQLSGLTTETDYEVYLRAKCGGENGVSAWSAPVSFKTFGTCPVPTNLTVTKIWDSSALISWVNGHDETAWELVYGASGFTPADSTPIAINAPSPYQLRFLTPGTSYDVYLRANCGAGVTSNWTAVASFQTIPTPVTLSSTSLSHSCGFESDTENNNWFFANDGQTNKWFIGEAVKNNGSKALYISNDASGTTHNYSLTATSTVYAYRTISIEAAGTLSFSYSWRANGQSGQDFLRVFLAPASTTLTAGNTSNITATGAAPAGWIALSAQHVSQNSWQTRNSTVDIAEEGLYNLVFYWRNNNTSGSQQPAAIDDITLTLVPNSTCLTPTGLTVSSLTEDAGRLSWKGENAVSYNVKVSSTSINAAVDPGNIFDLTDWVDDYFDLYSLTPAHTYYAYVQAVCGGGEPPTGWTSISFTTGCLPVAIPIIEHFDAYGTGEGAYPPCWRTSINKVGNVTTPQATLMPYVVENVYSGPDTKSLRMYAFYNAADKSSTRAFAIMPPVDRNLQGLSLRFDSYSTSMGTPLQVGAMTDISDASTFEPMAAITLGSWASHVVSFNAYTDAGKYIAFMIDGDAAQATYIANIDHVRLDSIRACQSPVSVKTANVTHDGATIVWEPLSQDDNKFQIQISTVNVGSKTEDADTISTFAADTVVTITDGVFSHTVTGLAERTDYYVYFRAVCADNSSGERYAQQVKFRTVCQIPAALPFVENFNSYGTGVGIIPECWTVDGTATNKPYCHTTHYGASGASLYFTSAAKTIGYAVLPELEAPLNTTQVSFMGYKTGTSSEITIGALTDPTDFDTFDSITTVTTSLINTWEEITVPLNGYTGTGRHLVFLIGTAYYFNIDNVIVELIPTCPRPASITVSNITDVSAEISVVSAGVETLWNLKYGPYGFNPETGGTLVSGLTATRHTLAGLLSSSHYEVYMQADCRTDGVSSWRGPADFYTEQAIELLPIISDFETDADAAMWRITSNGKANCFAVGSAERNNSSRALYISNDGGVSNIYTTTETAYSYATRKVSLPGGKYSISFDWKGIGEARYDLLRLFLIPASVSLTTGSEYGMSSGTNTTPAGWQDLGNDVLLGQSEWKTNTDTFMIEAGIYQLAFFWKNDNYGSVGNPPAAVDNVRFEAVECFIENLSVNNVTTTSANLSWISDAGTYQVIVDTVTHTTTELDALPTDVFYSNTALTTSALSLSVSANAYYYCYVRGVCDAAKTTEWKMVTFSTPTTLPLITGFEDATDNAKWQFSSNGGANGWVTGSASGAVKGGSGALYISNDGGSYDLNASSTSYAYAYRKIMVEKKGLYDIRFDWKAVGEGNYDLARVFLVPASEDLSTGNHFEMTGTRNATPNGWLDLGSGLTNGLFKGQSNWQSYAKAFALSVGEYQLAFFWKNDDGGDKAAPATIDNFRFKEGTCYAPVISMDNMEGTMVDISISSDVTTWQVIMDTVTHTTTELDALPTDVVYSNSAVTSNSLHLTGLSAVKLYHFYVRGVCGAGTYSPWAELVFSLPTALPFRADFEDPADNAQWQIGSNGGLNNWAFGTAAAKSGSGMYISNDGGVSNQYTINGTNSASYTYAYRKFFLDANSSYLLDFSWNGMGESYADIMRVFLVPTSFDLSSGSLHGMTTSGGSEATFPAAPAGWLDLVDPVTRKGKLSYNLTGEWQDFAEREVQVPTSDIYQLAFFWKNDAAAGAQPPAAVDDIFFRKILCATPIDLTASVAEDSVIIDWKAAQGNSWRLVVSSSAIDPETERGNVLDTVVNAHPVVIKGLSPSSTYNYYVQNHCIGDSLWSSEEVFTTPCGVSTIPFIEDFSSTIFPPNCWGSYEAEAASMFENTGKLAPLWLSGWKRATTGFGIARPHAVNNVYGLVNNWLITPTIHIGSSAVLLFDLAVTGYNNGNTVPAKQSDDRFMVIVSADAGNTWNSANATVWDNRGSSFVYDQIPNVAQRITIDLSPYSGQDVNIAFYSESTIIDSDNDLHIGNVEIATLVDVPVTDETCQEYDYAGFDVFSIPGTELTTAGKFSFSEYKNVSPGRYERLNLNLTVNATKEYNIAGTLCDGNSYSENGFNESVAGVYHHNLISSTGCDSTVILTLTEAQNAATSSLIIIAPDELPYHYHDTVIPVGASGSHVLVFHGTTVAGCDSTHTLTVSIGVDIPFTDTQTFNLLPNPVGRGNEVRIEADFSAADRNGLTVEVFNNVGACLLTLEPESYPIRLKGFDGSGVYVVRITTGRHEVYYGKLIVQ